MNLSTVEIWKHVSGGDGAVEVSGERLRELQGVLLRMLRDVVELCEREGIFVTMSGGTCLGAVRHRGFIPWDDDIDINIARNDLDRFLETMRREFPDRYLVQDVRSTDGYELALARVRLLGTVLRSKEDIKAPAEECGVYVDVFVVEDVPDNPLLRGLHGLASYALGFACSSARFHENREAYLEMAAGSREAERTFRRKVRLGRLFSFLPASTWCRLWDRLNSLCRDGSSRWVSIPGGRGHYFGELYRRADFFPATRGEFEGLSVPLPANPDAYLRALYGPDYMVPPPPEGREAHVALEFDLGKGRE